MTRYQMSIIEQNDERGRTWAFEVTRDGRFFTSDNGYCSRMRAVQEANVRIGDAQQSDVAR